MAQACLMPRGALVDDRPGERAPNSPQADFITSAARCKRKAASVACEGRGLRITANPGSPRGVAADDGDAGTGTGTPVKTIKLLHAFGWLPAATTTDGDGDRGPNSPRYVGRRTDGASEAALGVGSQTRTPPPCAAWDGGCRPEDSTSTSSAGSLSGGSPRARSMTSGADEDDAASFGTAVAAGFCISISDRRPGCGDEDGDYRVAGTAAATDAVVSTSDASASSSLPVQSPRPPGMLVVDDGEDDSALAWEFCPWLFIKRLPPLTSCVQPRGTPLLPRKSWRSPVKTLVLDLDETLVHSSLDGGAGGLADFTFDVDMAGVAHRVAVRRRPHLDVFLRRVAQLFEVVVFTASQAIYAEQLLDIVDPGRRLIRHRVFRDACVQWEGNYLKDLTVLGRDLAHTAIVDNSPQAFGFQLDNGIPIESWYDDDEDDELLRLLPFLEGLAQAEDVRPAIQQRFRLRELVNGVRDPCDPEI